MIYFKEQQKDGTFKIVESSQWGDRYVDADQPDYLAYLAEHEIEIHYYDYATDLTNLKATLTAQLSQDSFNAKEVLVPTYRETNAIRHKMVTGQEMYNYSVADINTLAIDCRAEFYRVKALIEEATTELDCEAAYNQKNFPITI